MKNNKVIKDIFIVALSNIIIALAGVVNGFIIPKVMSVTDYGFYKIFSLYATYITLLHFGFIDGILIMYAGKTKEELDKKAFKTYSRFLFMLELSASVIVIFIAVFLKGIYKFIFIMLAANILFTNVALYFQYISQVTERFKELTVRNILKSILNILLAIILFVLFKIRNYYVSSKSYIFYIVGINFILALWYMLTYRDLWIGKANKFNDEKTNIKHIFFEGLPYTIASFLASLIFTIDRQFVSIAFDTETYAVYAFAYNMLALITTATSAISTVLYPYLKRQENSKNLIYTLRSIISFVVAIMICSFFILSYIINWFLPKYVNSLDIFYIILPGLIFSSVNTIVLVNYFKIDHKQNIYMIISGIIVLLSLLANFIAYFLFKTTSSISWASTIIMVIWYVVLNIYFKIKYKISFMRNFIYCGLVTLGFYIIAAYINNILGFTIYITYIVLISILFNIELIKKFFRRLKNE